LNSTARGLYRFLKVGGWGGGGRGCMKKRRSTSREDSVIYFLAV
jgi:hypothetical protein